MPVACPAVLAAIGGAVSCERLKEPWPIDQFGCGFEIQPAQLTKRRAGRPEVQSCISLIPLGARPLVAARRRRARRENTWSCARWPMRPAPAKARSPAAPLDNSPMSAGWLDVVWRCKNLKREPLSSGVFRGLEAEGRQFNRKMISIEKGQCPGSQARRTVSSGKGEES